MRARAVIGVLIVAFCVLPATPGTAGPRVLTPGEMDVEFVRLWNEMKFDELGEFYYAENALFMPPNEEPVRGKHNIIERLKEVRQLFGEFQTGLQPLQVVETGDMASVVGNYAFVKGGVRLVTHEAFRRQADGGWKAIVDMPGFRDPQR
jgi:ketosteroid isomerase-like protein